MAKEGIWASSAIPKESYNYRRRLIFKTLFPVFGVPIFIAQILFWALSHPLSLTQTSFLRDHLHPQVLDGLLVFLSNSLKLSNSYPIISRALLTFASILAYNTLWTLLSDFIIARRAAQLGAVVIPCIKGRLPGNIDVLYEFLRREESFYHGDWIRELYEKHGCTTLNLRFFWMDQVCLNC